MRKVTFIILIGFALLGNLTASKIHEDPKAPSSKSIITGTITDKLTGEPLAGVEIKLLDTDIKIYTDFDGKFEMKDIVPGAQAIMVSYISYQDIIENVHTEAGNTSDLTIKLKSVDK